MTLNIGRYSTLSFSSARFSPWWCSTGEHSGPCLSGCSGAIRYRGRIDNGYADLGKPRQHVTSHDLRVSLDAVLAGRQVPAPETDALGCYIADPAAIRGKP